MDLKVRRTLPEDLAAVLKIYEDARQFMAETGNPRQWGQTNWPPEELIRRDIEIGRSYVCTDGDRILSVFCFTRGPEAGYEKLTAEPPENPDGRFPAYAGVWRDDSEYGVLHRLASVRRSGGAGKFCILWALRECGHLKVDTHTDNVIMQTVLEKLGFERRGYVIPEEDNDPRIAYERIGRPEPKTIYFAGGCFWGVQRYFDQFNGVLSTEVGYANGKTANPIYEELDETGHAETVLVRYDAAVLPLEQLLDDFFEVIDPFSINRQGPDIGTQYRTGIFYTDDDQIEPIRSKVRRVEEKAGRPVAVQVEPLQNYWTAEDGHQKYLNRIPWGYCHIRGPMFGIQERRTKAKYGLL